MSATSAAAAAARATRPAGSTPGPSPGAAWSSAATGSSPVKPRDSMATWTRSPRSKDRMNRCRPRRPPPGPARPSGVVAAGQAGDAHAPDLAGDDLGVADHEAGDGGEGPGHLQAVEPAQQLGTDGGGASRIVAATPRVPLARMFHAAHRPGSDSESPSTSVRGASPTSGRNRAKATNGTSITSRRASTAQGTAARRATPRAAGRRGRTPRRPPGVATTREHEGQRGRHLAPAAGGGGRRVSPGRCRPWLGGRAPPLMSVRSLLPVRRRATAGRGTPPADGEGHGDADDPGETGAQAVVVDTLDPVAGQRAVVQPVAGLLVGEALVDGHLVQAVGLAARLGADEERQGQGHGQAGDDEQRQSAAGHVGAPPPHRPVGQVAAHGARRGPGAVDEVGPHGQHRADGEGR